MSPRRSYSKKNKRSAKRSLKLDNIQIIGIAVVVLVVAAAAWAFLGRNSAGGAPNLVTNGDYGTPFTTTLQGAPSTGPKQYASAPQMIIDTNKQYFATVKMAKGGEFVIQLFADKAPLTVNSFVFLAYNKFYDGVTFHRVIDGFMAQGGDPTGTGTGGPGYQFVNEKNDLTFDKAGVVAMANAGPNTNGSQFFITFGPNQLSESNYTIFGQVVSGMDVVNGITRRDPQTNPTFQGDAMQSVTITVK